jgi:regulator of sigma E protease
MLTIIVVILIIALLILGHEWGHFMAAKRHGIRVDEFGLGFPPRIFSFKKGETLYSINLIPLGGFVRIYGDEGDGRGDKKSFVSHSALARIEILTAGVFMNLVLAFIFLSIAFGIGVPIPLHVASVDSASPAQEAGLMQSDVIISATYNSQTLDLDMGVEAEQNINSFQLFVTEAANKGQDLKLQVLRGIETTEVVVSPRASPPEGEGPLGIAIGGGLVKAPLHLAWWEGLKSTVTLTKDIVVAFGKIIKNAFVTGQVAEQLAGPVGIFAFIARATELGFGFLAQLTAILSINLAILNIIPFPALDGGRILFIGIEKIKGSPLSKKFEQTAHITGFLVLILFMIFITWRDIDRFF